MYPARELKRLAAHKVALQRNVSRSRAECAAAATRATQPLAWLDRVVAFWRRLSPLVQFAAVPLGFFVQRRVFRRRKSLRSLVRWGGVIFGVVRAISAAARMRPRSAADADVPG